MQTAVVVLCFFIFLGQVVGQDVKWIDVCYGSGACAFQTLSCSKAMVFLLKAQYGYKDSTLGCSSLDCSKQSTCCTSSGGACFEPYSVFHFERLYRDCFGQGMCSVRGEWSLIGCRNYTSNGATFEVQSSYSHVEYTCLDDGDVTAFHDTTAITAPAVAVRYNSSDVTSYPMADTDSEKTWHCQVDTADSVQRQADVILVRESHEDGPKSGASTVGWSGGSYVPFSRTFQYTDLNATTPFSLSVKVGDRRIPDGWAVVRSQDGSNLIVRCGYTGNVSATSTTSAKTGASPSSMQTTDPTFGSEGSQKNVHLGVTVAGWVVAAVLSVCLAVLICRLGGCKGMAQLCSKRQTTSGHLTSSRDQTGDDTYLEVIPDSASPASDASTTHAYVNATGVDTIHSSGDRSQSQPEYSPMDWSRDSANAYSQLG